MLKAKESISRILLVLVTILLLVNPTQLKADAVCQDGWYSQSSGSGTCSHHGGVSYWVTDEVNNYPVFTFAPLVPQFNPQIGATPLYIDPPVIETRPLYTSLPKSNSESSGSGNSQSVIFILIAIIVGCIYWFKKSD